jgi:hypothetical protein
VPNYYTLELFVLPPGSMSAAVLDTHHSAAIMHSITPSALVSSNLQLVHGELGATMVHGELGATVVHGELGAVTNSGRLCWPADRAAVVSSWSFHAIPWLPSPRGPSDGVG